MPRDSSRKKKARREQASTGDSYMRARRQLDADGGAAGAPAGSQERLLSLLGLGQSGGVPDVTTAWSEQLSAGRNAHLRVPVGLQVDGSPVWLDLADSFSGGNGPHGLMVGTTGSGKSTVLQSVLFALCVQNSPEVLQLRLISAKDESTFGDFTDYAHVSVIPDGSDYTSVLSALVADRNAALRAAAELSDESDGQGLQEARSVEQRAGEWSSGGVSPLPVTVVVISDFTELARRDDGLISVVESLTRKGRSLGVHVLIASQVLDPIDAGRIAVNASYRVALGGDRLRSEWLTGSDTAELPGARGSGLFVSSPGADPVAFQGFMVSRDLVRDVGHQVAAVGHSSES